MQPEFVDYQKSIRANARALSDELAGGGFRLVSGGTDNHMVLVDLAPMGLTGRQAEEALGKVNIVVNRNAIPLRSQTPASGQRPEAGDSRRDQPRLRDPRHSPGGEVDNPHPLQHPRRVGGQGGPRRGTLPSQPVPRPRDRRLSPFAVKETKPSLRNGVTPFEGLGCRLLLRTALSGSGPAPYYPALR